MKCWQKLKMEHPDEYREPWLSPVCSDKCSHHYGYLEEPSDCPAVPKAEDCKQCWDREIPGTEIIPDEYELEKENQKKSLTETLEKTKALYEKMKSVSLIRGTLLVDGNISIFRLSNNSDSKDFEFQCLLEGLEMKIQSLEDELYSLDIED